MSARKGPMGRTKRMALERAEQYATEPVKVGRGWRYSRSLMGDYVEQVPLTTKTKANCHRAQWVAIMAWGLWAGGRAGWPWFDNLQAYDAWDTIKATPPTTSPAKLLTAAIVVTHGAAVAGG